MNMIKVRNRKQGLHIFLNTLYEGKKNRWGNQFAKEVVNWLKVMSRNVGSIEFSLSQVINFLAASIVMLP